jgi:hypothetical protein
VTARLLLVVFCGMLLVPLLPASTLEAGLAICCKRSGKHLCIAQGIAEASSSSSGSPSISEKCLYTVRHALATGIAFGAAAGHAQALLHESSSDQLSILSGFSTRPHQANLKRGPPARSTGLYA